MIWQDAFLMQKESIEKERKKAYNDNMISTLTPSVVNVDNVEESILYALFLNQEWVLPNHFLS